MDLLPEEFLAMQPESFKNAIILVAIVFGLLNVIMDIYWKLSRFRGARKFWIKHLTRADKNFDFAVSNFNWFILTPVKLSIGLLVFCYLTFFALALAPFYFGAMVSFSITYWGAPLIVILVYYIHRKVEKTTFLKFSETSIKKLRDLVKYSLVLRYTSYSMILFILYLLILLETPNNPNTSLQNLSETISMITEKYSIVTAVILLIIVISAFSIITSYKSQRIAVDYLRRNLNEHYVNKPDVTIFTDTESGKISGKLTDIFDKGALMLEDENGQKFLIPWKSIDFLAVKSVKSADLADAKTDAKEDVTESSDLLE